MADTLPSLGPSPPATAAAASAPTDPAAFTYPPHYSFPPFYTLQPNLTTRASQLASWSALILAYASAAQPTPIFRLSPSHAIFTNTALKRSLAPADAREVLASMVEHGRAAWIDATAAKQRRANEASDGAEVWLYWRTPEEWAALLAGWVEATGQRNTVLTLYELLEGDATLAQPFHGMPAELARAGVAVLVRRGKAQTLGEGEGLGVKFF